jgi:hypothetical protein
MAGVALQEIESSLLPALDFQSNREIVMVQGRCRGEAAELMPNHQAAVSGVLFQLQKCIRQQILLTFLLF